MKKPLLVSLMIAPLVLSGCGGGGDSSPGVDAPASLSGRTYDVTIGTGVGIFATAGSWTIRFTDDDEYQISGDSFNVPDSFGLYSYTASGSRGTVTFNDSIVGSGTNVLSYSSETTGTYRSTVASDPASFQTGSFQQR